MTYAVNLAQSASSESSFKNRIINGDMRIDQRNAGTSVTSANDAYTADRWKYGSSQASKFTVQQVSTAPSGFTNSLKMTVASAVTVGASDYFTIFQPIEGLNVADLAWGTASAATVTLSFWVYSSLTGTFGGTVRNNAGNRSYPYSYTINAVNTWEQKFVTIIGDTTGTWLTTNGYGIGVYFGLGIGSTYSGTANTWASTIYLAPTGSTSVVGTAGATFYITGVQLEKGSVATSFDYRPYESELQLCQRYFCKTFPQTMAVAQGADTSNLYGLQTEKASGSNWYGTVHWYFPVTMRTIPGTVTTYNPTQANANFRNDANSADYLSTGTGKISEIKVEIFSSNVIATNTQGLIHVTAQAEL